jgi:hypothetical protein
VREFILGSEMVDMKASITSIPSMTTITIATSILEV